MFKNCKGKSLSNPHQIIKSSNNNLVPDTYKNFIQQHIQQNDSIFNKIDKKH